MNTSTDQHWALTFPLTQARSAEATSNRGKCGLKLLKSVDPPGRCRIRPCQNKQHGY